MGADYELNDVETGTRDVQHDSPDTEEATFTCMDPSIRPKTATLSWQQLTVVRQGYTVP